MTAAGLAAAFTKSEQSSGQSSSRSQATDRGSPAKRKRSPSPPEERGEKRPYVPDLRSEKYTRAPETPSKLRDELKHDTVRDTSEERTSSRRPTPKTDPHAMARQSWVRELEGKHTSLMQENDALIGENRRLISLLSNAQEEAQTLEELLKERPADADERVQGLEEELASERKDNDRDREKLAYTYTNLLKLQAGVYTLSRDDLKELVEQQMVDRKKRDSEKEQDEVTDA
ncbi:hypothetical protein LTS18_008494 [Coniosporium uncinatum]|uniref:Uncharacterized protein n=1 Tax=Coniosporium uncinatum TaxID=93489 RepID=A0ACC3DNA6_9PEZI|nr:hypothetical protein LTS18_008494 [Coniosporium uncinatum]